MKLMVLDGNSIVNRAYYGVGKARLLTTRQGLHTNAIYGFVTMLQKLLDQEKPDAVCAAFDRREPTFRHKADAAYKANRKGMPEELAEQMLPLKQVLDAMSVPCYELSGYEADDLIGTISRKCEAAGWDCTIATGDRDSLQLITAHTHVRLLTGGKGPDSDRCMTESTFRAEYGFDPIHMIDLKALAGDSSDNIPGVPGIGEKTAMALVQQYGSIDAVYANIDSVPLKPGFLCKLKEGEASARHSYWLATIDTNAPLDFDPEANLRQPFKPELYDLFLKLEFQKLIDKYQLSPACVAEELPTYTAEAEILETAERAEACLALWREAAYVTVYGTPDLAALAVECETGADSSLMVEIYVNRYAGDWRALLSALFAPDIRKVGHSVKDMMRALLAQGLPADGFIFDTALAAYLVDATAGSYDLQRLFVTYYNEQLPQPDHLTADAFNPLAGENIAAQTALISYTAAVSALHGTLAPKLRELEMEELYYTVELPLCRVLADMETAGFLVDREALADFGAALQKTTDRVEQAIYDAAGETFNINSPKQLGYILFEKLQLPHGKKTKTGWSTNADVLEKLRHAYPIVDDVLCFRQYTKLKSTYVDGLMKVIDMDGRIRTSFQMTVTATGRLSSTEPNLQNIPTRTELGSQLRRMFTAAEGCVLVDADYSQIELRLLAHMSGDKVMQASFLSGTDFHTATAAKVFHVPEEDVTPELRRRAKAVNFGIVYGISAFALAQDIGVTVAEAKAYMDRYFETYSTLRQYMTDVVAQAEQDSTRIYIKKSLHYRANWHMLKSILLVGIPNGLENSMFQLGKILVLSLVSTFGTYAIAANAVGNVIAGFQLMAGMAASLAMVTVVSRCVGAGDYEQAKYYTIKVLTMAYICIIVTVLFTFAVLPLVMKAYGLSYEAQSAAEKILMLHGIAASTIWPVAFTLPCTFRAAGDVKYSMIVSICTMWICRIVFSYVLGKYMGMGVFGVWVAMIMDQFVRGVLFIRRYLSGRWIGKKVI